MIDRSARDKALELLAQVASGQVTNWELEDRWPRSRQDPALNCIMRWLWTLYDDDRASRMIDVLEPSDLEILTRCVRFLESDEEFKLRSLDAEEARKEQMKWGTEWIPGCTLPDDDTWPFREG